MVRHSPPSISKIAGTCNGCQRLLYEMVGVSLRHSYEPGISIDSICECYLFISHETDIIFDNGVPSSVICGGKRPEIFHFGPSRRSRRSMTKLIRCSSVNFWDELAEFATRDPWHVGSLLCGGRSSYFPDDLDDRWAAYERFGTTGWRCEFFVPIGMACKICQAFLEFRTEEKETGQRRCCVRYLPVCNTMNSPCYDM